MIFTKKEVLLIVSVWTGMSDGGTKGQGASAIFFLLVNERLVIKF